MKTHLEHAVQREKQARGALEDADREHKRLASQVKTLESQLTTFRERAGVLEAKLSGALDEGRALAEKVKGVEAKL